MAEQEQTPPPPNEGQKKTLKIVLIVLAVLFVLGVLGTLLLGFIGVKIGENIVEEATNSNISRDGDNIKIESDDGSGSVELNASELPDDFPEGAPLFEPATLTSSSSYSNNDDGKVWVATYETDSSAQDVFDFYKSRFDSGDWKTERTADTGDFKSVSGLDEAAKLRTAVNITADSDGQTEYVVTVTQGL